MSSVHVLKVAPAGVCLLLSSMVAPAAEMLSTEPVVVTATRTAQTADETLASVQVITREQIERSQAGDVAGLLRFLAGVDVARNGGPGQATSVFMRGAESNHTLLLIDGVKVNTGTDGGAPWQNINPAMIERIEIVRGPRSALYGSEAIGGVIQIFTRRAQADVSESGAIGLGSDNTFRAEGNIGGRKGRFRGGMGLSYYGTDGFQSRTAATRDRGFNNTSLNLYAGADLGVLDVELSSWLTKGKSEYFDFFLTPVDQDFDNSVTALTLRAAPAEDWNTSLKISRSRDNIKQNQSSDVTRTERWAADWQNDIRLGEYQMLTAGAYVATEETDSIVFGSGFEGKDKTVKAVFAQDQIDAGDHSLLLAARYTDDGFFGEKTTWNLAYGYRLTEVVNLFASVGTGFKAPSSLDLFGYGGNSDLRAETSKNYEFGVHHQFGPGHTLAVTAFQNSIDDLIAYRDPDGFLGPIPGQNVNIDRARIRGVELQYRFLFGPLSGNVSATRQNPEDRDSGDQLPRRAKKSLAAVVNYRTGRFVFGGKFLATGERPDTAFTTNELGGYGVLDLNASVQLTPKLRLQGTVENLFDKDYETAGGFKTQGRALFVNLRLGGG